jgi:ParB family transcriptional regulator, chromosome partitioning protein
MKNEFKELDISKIYPNPEQPRKTFENIEDLALTIKYNGLINPITVVKSDEDKYMIVSGERRYRACLLNQYNTIKCNIVDIDEFQLQEMTLIENIQRDDLTDFEKAKYIGFMWSLGKYEKKQDLAAALGKSQSYISKAFSCLKLDETILQDLENNSCDVPLSVLDEISKIKDKDNQKNVYTKYLNNEITRDEIRIIKPENVKNFARENLDNKYPEELFDFEEKFTQEITLKKFELEIYGQDGILYYTDIIEGAFKNNALLKAYQKYPNESQEGFRFELIEIKDEDVLDSFQESNEVKILKAKIQELEKEIEQLKNKDTLDNYVAYGFGTQNTFGTFIALSKGDFTGSIQLETNTDIIKHCDNTNYQVIIKEINIPKEELKEIKLIEVYKDNVYIEFTDFDSDTLSFSKAKELIKKSTQKSIPFTIFGNNDKSCDFINKMPYRTQQNGNLILKDNKSKKSQE